MTPKEQEAVFTRIRQDRMRPWFGASEPSLMEHWRTVRLTGMRAPPRCWLRSWAVHSRWVRVVHSQSNGGPE